MIGVPTTADLRSITRPRVGLALPASRIPGGYVRSKQPLDTAWGDLMQAVLTPIGARPMARAFGSPLRDYLFDPNDSRNQPLIEQAIRAAAATWTPHVVIFSVEVRVVPEGRVQVAIRFGLLGDSEPAERMIEVNRKGEISVAQDATAR